MPKEDLGQFLIILRGPAGSGKTSLAKDIQDRVGEGLAVIDTDIFSWQVVPGEPNKRLVFGNIAMLAENYLQWDRNVVISGLILTAEEAGTIERLRKFCIDKGTRFRDFYCHAPRDLVVQRNKDRNKDVPESWVRHWSNEADRDKENVSWELNDLDMRKDINNLTQEVMSVVRSTH